MDQESKDITLEQIRVLHDHGLLEWKSYSSYKDKISGIVNGFKSSYKQFQFTVHKSVLTKVNMVLVKDANNNHEVIVAQDKIRGNATDFHKEILDYMDVKTCTDFVDTVSIDLMPQFVLIAL